MNGISNNELYSYYYEQHNHLYGQSLNSFRHNNNAVLPIRTNSITRPRYFHSSPVFYDNVPSPSAHDLFTSYIKGKKKTKKKNAQQSSSSETTTNATNIKWSGDGSRKKQRRNGKNKQKSKMKAAKKQKQQPKQAEEFQHRASGENGRPIMTKQRLKEMLSSGSTPSSSSFNKEVCERAKNHIHDAQRKMSFTQKYDHETDGPNHDRQFIATLRTTIDKSCLPFTVSDHAEYIISNSTSSTTIELVNTGSSPRKAWAEQLAAADLVAQFTEMGIDILNPPDMVKQHKAQREEQFKSRIQRGQMLLEVLNVSNPRYTTVELVTSTGRRDGYESNISFYCKGAPISASGKGKSKAEAEGLALIAATSERSGGGFLGDLLGQEKMVEIHSLMDSSPGGHVAALTIPPLPDEAFDVMVNAMGSYGDHLRRMEQHAKMKERFEREFHERRLQRRERGEGRNQLQGAFAHLKSSANDNTSINEAFLKEEELRMEKATSDPEGKQGQMKSIRDALPIKAIQDGLVDALKSQQVVVVSGGTGSGKSTQCPQYILEDAISNGKGAETRIVVTQPRRIAAISVAERIADERDESIGNSVGYTVRFNKRNPREAGASIEFVTTGVLLRRLVNDQSLKGVSHVMIDEVHERDIDTDFLLVLLRDLLKSKPDLRVILMSATLDAESFGEYFSSHESSSPVPVMSVPTKPRHPVEVINLEDMTSEGDIGIRRDIPSDIQTLSGSLLQLHDQQLQLELEEALAEDSAASKLEARSIAEDEGSISPDDSDSGSDSDSDDDIGGPARRGKSLSRPSRLETLRRAVSMRSGDDRERVGQQPLAVRHSQKDRREIGDLTTKLLAKLAQHMALSETNAGRKGSVLCFLPGLDEIKEAMAILEDESDSSLLGKMKILPLHSTIPQNDQQRVFIPADDGTVKVILATNIAESSVTIDDVLCVIDGGLVRELNWDAEKSMSTMVTVPTSKASATQRLGRAGRVAPGKCYRIYSRGQHEAMIERPMPEIQRTALEATCLNTCSMTEDSVETFLSRAMDPPKPDAVAYSMDRLTKLGAIAVAPSGKESLSPLGTSLSKLPLDPATGRMLIMGCVHQVRIFPRKHEMSLFCSLASDVFTSLLLPAVP